MLPMNSLAAAQTAGPGLLGGAVAGARRPQATGPFEARRGPNAGCLLSEGAGRMVAASARVMMTHAVCRQ